MAASSPGPSFIQRVASPREKPYWLADRAQTQREDLSWEATGMWSYLCSLPDDWRINRTDLSRRKTNGGHSTRRIMRELREKGYLRLVRDNDPTTGLVSNYLEFYEDPMLNPDVAAAAGEVQTQLDFDHLAGNQPPGNQPPENQPVENQPSTVHDSTEDDRLIEQNGKCAVPSAADNPYKAGTFYHEVCDDLLVTWSMHKDTPPLLQGDDNVTRMMKLIEQHGQELVPALDRLLQARNGDARTLAYAIPLLETETRWFE